MINIMILMIPFSLLSLTLLLMNFFMSKKIQKNREKISPFECGFDPMENNRMPFSIQFFLISLIFLIFDIEITLLIPLIFTFMKIHKIMIFSFMFFLIILILGLYMEFLEQSIDWKS